MRTKSIIFSAVAIIATIIILYSSKKDKEFNVYNFILPTFDEVYIINNNYVLTERDFTYFITNEERRNYQILNFYKSILNLNKYFTDKQSVLSFKGNDFLFFTKLKENQIDSLKILLFNDPSLVKKLPFVKNNPIVFSNNGLFISNNGELISETIKKSSKKSENNKTKELQKILSSNKTINYLTKDSLNNWKGFDVDKINDSTWQINYVSINNKQNNGNFEYSIPKYLKDNRKDSLKINQSSREQINR